MYLQVPHQQHNYKKPHFSCHVFSTTTFHLNHYWYLQFTFQQHLNLRICKTERELGIFLYHTRKRIRDYISFKAQTHQKSFFLISLLQLTYFPVKTILAVVRNDMKSQFPTLPIRFHQHFMYPLILLQSQEIWVSFFLIKIYHLFH